MACAALDEDCKERHQQSDYSPLEQALKSSNLPVATEAAELLFRLDHRGNAAHKTVSRELLLRTMEESDNKELAVFINKLFVEEREAKEMDLDYLLNS